ncbi:hypothetical protein GJ629_08855 [Halapricum sp. CBA1109]|uniref:hypothetical protein n=1 Tax=Halapricum sp. CBA1109 TaxID=2668068 RepID=UPI0012F89590|nr:hypothetical protein [Halapricum sp. CBA1109]MUV89986.1 hypothetical protein [Halapricum sp. CBA1109]
MAVTTGELVLLAASLVALGLALFIVFHAYRGARRNDSQRMFALATGLCLLTVVPTALSVAVTALGPAVGVGSDGRTLYLPLSQRLFEIAGLVTLLYSLLLSPGR